MSISHNLSSTLTKNVVVVCLNHNLRYGCRTNTYTLKGGIKIVIDTKNNSL